MSKPDKDEMLSAAIADIALRAGISYAAAEKHVEDLAIKNKMIYENTMRQMNIANAQAKAFAEARW